jgi:hypothetical protein
VEKQSKLADSMGPLTEEDIRQIKKKARVIIPQRVEYYAKMAGISYNRIFIRLQKSRWGSCSVVPKGLNGFWNGKKEQRKRKPCSNRPAKNYITK